MAALTGLTPQQLIDHGLKVLEGRTIDGQLSYERPVFVMDPRRIKNCALGAYSYINGYGSASLYSTEVGRYCSIAESAVIGAPEHPTDWLSTHPFAFTRPAHMPKFYESTDFQRLAPEADSDGPQFEIPDKTRIGHDVWIGTGAQIRRGVTIGDGAVIAAHAMVTHDVPPYAVVVGQPARVTRLRFDDTIVERLIKLEWWRYDLAPHKHALDFSRIEAALDSLDELLAAGELQALRPDSFRVLRQEQGFDIEPLPAPLYFNDTDDCRNRNPEKTDRPARGLHPGLGQRL